MRGSILRSGAFLTAAFAVGVTASCSKIVGIEATNVEARAGAGASSGGSSGAGGAAGASNGQGGKAGSATGSGGSGGTDAGGKGGTGAQTGGTGGGTGGGSTNGGSGAGGGSGGAKASGGTGGKLPTGGAGGASTTGGTGGTSAAGGEGGASDACGGAVYRCNADGVREECTNGSWATAACPPDKPSCIGNDCGVRGPKLVSAGSYFIDATEVTVGEYKAFTDAKGTDTSGQSSACAWNTDFKPAGDPGTDPNLPVSFVDWCDAAAFCKWADEHLCAGIAGAALTKDELFDASVSEWFQACGAGGSHPKNNAECNSVDGNGDAVAVASMPNCEGYYPGLFDMEGNVAEWVDVCDADTGASDVCHALGGSWVDGQSFCTEDYDYFTRDKTASTIGFRCCSG